MTELTYLPTERVWPEYEESDMWNEFFNWYFSDDTNGYWAYYLNSDMIDIR